VPAIKNRRQNPSPEIEYSEIHIPDDKNLGAGTFTILLKPNVLSGSKVIAGMLVNVPVFQISVNVNPATREIPVLLGKADGSNPISSKLFLFPSDLDSTISHTLVAKFQNWQVAGLEFDGLFLTQKNLN